MGPLSFHPLVSSPTAWVSRSVHEMTEEPQRRKVIFYATKRCFYQAPSDAICAAITN